MSVAQYRACHLNIRSFMQLYIQYGMATNKTQIRFLTFPFSHNHNAKQAIDNLHKVEIEDEEVVLNVQKGVQSRFYKNGRYSAEYEKGTHHFHRLICKYINQSV